MNKITKMNCSGCDERFSENKLTRDDYNEYYCNDCFDEKYEICECGCFLDKEEEDDEWETIDGVAYCMDCSSEAKEEETWECEECGKEIVEKEISRHYVEGGCVCNDCDKENQ